MQCQKLIIYHLSYILGYMYKVKKFKMQKFKENAILALSLFVEKWFTQNKIIDWNFKFKKKVEMKRKKKK